jgi:hypothetical protein
MPYKHYSFNAKSCIKGKGKAIPVTGRGGL